MGNMGSFLTTTRSYLKRTQAFRIKMLRFVRFTKSLQYFWCAAPVQSKSLVMKEAHDSSIQTCLAEVDPPLPNTVQVNMCEMLLCEHQIFMASPPKPVPVYACWGSCRGSGHTWKQSPISGTPILCPSCHPHLLLKATWHLQVLPFQR